MGPFNFMKTIYIIPIEPIDARYTKQWYENIPKILQDEIASHQLPMKVVTIDGFQPATGTTKGAFLDFAVTNIYKASQTQKVSELFSQGVIKKGDKFLVTDAWNPIITPIKYMSDLLDIPVEIHGIWHAGNYDPSDILGYKMKGEWASHVERSWFHSCDYNYYATNFHMQMFLKNLDLSINGIHNKAIRSGQPHTPIIEQCEQYWSDPKADYMIWPHRYNADKQPKIVEDLKYSISGETIITQQMNLSKEEYYKVLGNCSVIFSCSLHENLGISVMEAVLAGVIPILPDRCSYSEMYLPEFLYPSEWTSSYENYCANTNNLADFINYRLKNRNMFLDRLAKQKQILIEKYLTPTVMINKLLETT
jgi:hypothetical protein